MTEPTDSKTASETKFSDAISSRFRDWRSVSCRIAFATSGSTCSSRCMLRLPAPDGTPVALLELRDLAQAPAVAPALELAPEPHLEDLQRQLGAGQAAAEGQDVRV